MSELTCEDVGCLCGGFWIVLRDDGRNSGSLVRHASEMDARAECERLSRKEQRPFYVLKTVAKAAPTSPPIEWHELGHSEAEGSNE